MGPVVVEPILLRYPQTLGDPIDVVEIGDHLRCAGNALVVEPGVSKNDDVCDSDGGWCPRQLLGVFAQGDICGVESRGPPIQCDPVGQLLVFDLIPEIVQMCRYSVVTLVHLRCHHGHHLPLGTGEG